MEQPGNRSGSDCRKYPGVKGGQNMKDFMLSFKFIISFLVLTILFNMFFGQRAATRFLQLVLASMLMINADSVISWVEKLNPFGAVKGE